ncbi:hypothetical protein H1R20_g9379, partial [Candolleomyces eurysporus]
MDWTPGTWLALVSVTHWHGVTSNSLLPVEAIAFLDDPDKEINIYTSWVQDIKITLTAASKFRWELGTEISDSTYPPSTDSAAKSSRYPNTALNLQAWPPSHLTLQPSSASSLELDRSALSYQIFCKYGADSMAATKTSFSIRIDALTGVNSKSEESTNSIGAESRLKLEKGRLELENRADYGGVKSQVFKGRKQGERDYGGFVLHVEEKKEREAKKAAWKAEKEKQKAKEAASEDLEMAG